MLLFILSDSISSTLHTRHKNHYNYSVIYMNSCCIMSISVSKELDKEESGVMCPNVTASYLTCLCWEAECLERERRREEERRERGDMGDMERGVPCCTAGEERRAGGPGGHQLGLEQSERPATHTPPDRQGRLFSWPALALSSRPCKDSARGR